MQEISLRERMEILKIQYPDIPYFTRNDIKPLFGYDWETIKKDPDFEYTQAAGKGGDIKIYFNQVAAWQQKKAKRGRR